MLRHSFTVNGVDMRETYGLTISKHTDVLTPKLRERKLSIPMRDGAYDYGAKYYDERMLQIECTTTKLLTRAEIRELSLAISKKAEIRLWDEPDKYYVGRIYDEAEIVRKVGSMRSFTMLFVCEPFAYGVQKTESFESSAELTYQGTARAPIRITVTNPNAYAMKGIVITIREAIS